MPAMIITKTHRMWREIAEREGVTRIRFESVRRSSHCYIVGEFAGHTIRTMMTTSQAKGTGDPRFMCRVRGNIRQAIRRAINGMIFR